MITKPTLTIAERYAEAIEYAKEHIKELEQRLEDKQNLVDTILMYFIDSTHPEEDERTATRRIYRLIYGDKWKNKIPDTDSNGESLLTIKESQEWFDDNHDDWFCSGDAIANAGFKELMNWELQEIGKEVGHEASY